MYKNNHFSKKALVNSLLDDSLYHIEFNGHLTNHNKHAVIAFYGLGASEKQIKSYYDTYAAETPYGYPLEKSKPSQFTIDQNNWKNYLGKRTSFSSYCDFFDAKEKELGMNKLLQRYVPTLLPGWVGSLTHGTIHLGWALEMNHRWMIIEGLAYMAFSYVSCHPEKIKINTTKKESLLDRFFEIAHVWENHSLEFKDWVEGLISIDNDSTKHTHPELVRSGLQYRIAMLLSEGHPLIYSFSTWIDDEQKEIVWRDLYYIVALIYMAYPGDFLILHLVTSLHAMEQIANQMPLKLQKHVARCFWVGMLCILFSRAEFPSKIALEDLNKTYQNAFDTFEIQNKDIIWKETIDKALNDKEEHNAKLVYVLQKIWKNSGYRTIFRVASNFSTTTPQLPESFKMLPIE